MREQLYLLLHGSFAFVVWEKEKKIQAFLPQVDDHLMKAGLWWRELRLVEWEKYRLEGVETGTISLKQSFPQNENPVVDQRAPIGASADNVFCTFELPMPSDIKALRYAPRENGKPFFQQTSPEAKEIEQRLDCIAEAWVFVYTIRDGESPRFVPDIGGQLNQQLTDTRNRIVHIFSEEDTPIGYEHLPRCEKALNDIFGGLSLFLENYNSSELFTDHYSKDIPDELRKSQFERLVGAANKSLGNMDVELFTVQNKTCRSIVSFMWDKSAQANKA